MRRWKTLALVTMMAGLPASAGFAEKKTWTFDDDTPGAIARGFTSGSGEWKVVTTDEGKALAQLAESPNADFNVALVDGTKARDVDISVRIRAVAGKNDQGGGVVWRAQDARNYYVARFNHIEGFLDGNKSLDLTDSSFAEAGQIGIWSKSDARTQFDDLTMAGESNPQSQE